jgi:beta-carotene ketolase (CrtW type)
MWEYTTLLQIAKIILASQVLQALGVPYANLCVYMAGAPLLAAFRLFYFGTYLPHLPPDSSTIMGWQKSHSSDDPSWLTFLKCYHFGLHWEHHRWACLVVNRQHSGLTQHAMMFGGFKLAGSACIHLQWLW